jgi:murein DD-endopeptidase MepM/ murein hydrolase activator NlpD
MGEFKAFLDTINGSNAGGAALQGIQEVLSGLGSALTGFMTGLLGAGGLGGLKSLLGKLLPGAGSAAADAVAGVAESGAAAAEAGAGAGVGAGALAVPFAAAAAVLTSQTMSFVQHQTAKAAHDGSYEKLVANDYKMYHLPNSILKPKPGKKLEGIALFANQWTNMKLNQEKQLLSDYHRTGGGNSSTISANGVTGSAAGKGKVTFIMPVNGKISDGYGPRTPPTPTASSFHHGIDIVASEGTPIHASADGQVVSAAPNSSFGNLTTISHANGFRTLYAHQSRFGVSAGATVTQGQVIGYVGTTGNSTGPHLHFEVHDASGSPIDPMKVIGGSFNGVATQGSNTNPKHATSGSIASGIDLSAIIDSRASASSASPGSYTGASYASRNGGSGNDTSSRSGGIGASGSMGGSGNSRNTSGNNLLTNNRMSIYLPGVDGAKTGKDYVANDGPVNVHSGEAILTAEQASVWRSAIKGGGLGKGGNNVNITVNIQSASETEARRFASLVKEHLENDQMIHAMGSK